MDKFVIDTYLNPVIAIVLWALGAYIKNSTHLKKFANDLIPVALVVVGIVLSFVLSGLSTDSFVSGLLTAIFCVGTHGTAKDLYYQIKTDK